jgi:hypothetical protein
MEDYNMSTDFDTLAGKPRLISIDFDGVLHWYRSGYHDGTIYDIPTPGAKEAIKEYMKHFTVVIYSSRASTPEGLYAIQGWLRFHGFPDIPVVSVKPPAFLHIDDRAVTFTGTWPNPDDITNFKVWNGVEWGKK